MNDNECQGCRFWEALIKTNPGWGLLTPRKWGYCIKHDCNTINTDTCDKREDRP